MSSSWIEANFKETDLAKMRVGQPAELWFDAYPELKLQGPCRQHRRRDRFGIFGAARAKCQRQLGQGDAAGAGADRHRRQSPRARCSPDFRPMSASTPADSRRDRGGSSRTLASRHTGLLMAAVMVMSVCQFIDMTIANVALPHMQTSLGASMDTISWVADQLHHCRRHGHAADRMAVRPVGFAQSFIWASALFLLASVLCGAATSLTQMVIFRALQGIGAAFIGPMSQTIMFDINRAQQAGAGDVDLGHGGDDRADQRAVPWRISDRDAELALGILRQSADRDSRLGDAVVAAALAPDRPPQA